MTAAPTPPTPTSVPKAAARPPVRAKQTAAKRPAAPPATPRKPFSLRPRLLPLTIFGAVLLLGARVGDIWTAVATGGEFPDVAGVVASQQVTEGLPPDRPAFAATAAAVMPVQVAEAATGPANGAAEPAPGAADPAASPAPAEPAAAQPTGKAEDRAFTPSEVELLQRLQERREQIESRARELDQREALVQVAEQRLDQKIGELDGLKQEIASLIQQVNEQETAQLDSLVKIYETMKPKEAAAVFEQLDEVVLLDVIGRMRESKLAPIFGAMDPAKASRITALRAARPNLPPLPQ